MKDYRDLDVWKYSRSLVKSVYQLTETFPKNKLYGLTNQIRRCLVSVPSNIAEGVGIQSNKETIRFLYIAKGSLFECQLNSILFESTSCKKLLNGFINYFKNKS